MAKIKICGLSRPCDIETVNTARPDYIGFVFARSTRQVSLEQALRLREKLRGDIVPVGVFVNGDMENIRSAVTHGIIDAVQLHGDETEADVFRIKELTGKPVIKAVSVQNTGDVQKWNDSRADYLILDRQGGGSGKPFDWNLIGKTDKSFFLAGGINEDNIMEAINRIDPYAVDVSSGVESDGVKDERKILSIVRKIRQNT